MKQEATQIEVLTFEATSDRKNIHNETMAQMIPAIYKTEK